MEIGVPPECEIQRVADRIHGLQARSRTLREALEAMRSSLDQLDESILASAFRGGLVPQDPNDQPASVLLERIGSERQAAGVGRSLHRRRNQKST